MTSNRLGCLATLFVGLLVLPGCTTTVGELLEHAWIPEQRTVAYRDSANLPTAGQFDGLALPRTVSEPQDDLPAWNLSLDEAIRIGIANARVIRVLTGLSASSSGQTIYDPAIANTVIDQESARFNPTFRHSNNWNRFEPPGAFSLPDGRTLISGSSTDDYRSGVNLNKTNVIGGQWNLEWSENPARFGNGGPFPLDPQNRSAVELSYSQPLLRGGGYAVNTAPIVLARVNTERSFFQFKDSVQNLVSGIIEGYWGLVAARTDVWARGIQLDLAKERLGREEARLKVGLGSAGEVAQARVTVNSAKANLLTSQAEVLNREAALRNILFLPPTDTRQIVPVSFPTTDKYMRDWPALLRLAEQRRPDIVELKLILEADRIRLLQANNANLPQFNATALYRWNGLSGQAPNGEYVSTRPGEFTDWTLGVNFSVPLGLRQERAALRQQELIVRRDEANLQQGLHAMVHNIAQQLREIDSAYEQYKALRLVREAAYDNLKVQIEEFRARGGIFLNFLQALNDWGNSVSAEARALTSYNTLLAGLERATGTILETHGLVFYEERQKFAGPLGIFGHGQFYPEAIRPLGEPNRYPPTDKPSEESFDLMAPNPRGSLPPAPPMPPPPGLTPPVPPKPNP